MSEDIKRLPLKSGEKVVGGHIYNIESVLGIGGNAITYIARYDDSSIGDDGDGNDKASHKCILKELFPYCPGIYRDEKGTVCCDTQDNHAVESMALHKKSFVHGNKIHISMLENNPDEFGSNIDTFEANGTLYTVLGINSVTTLRMVRDKFREPRRAVLLTIRLLDNLKYFHENGFLHLDISPDNIIISESGDDFRVRLIDFNGSIKKRDESYDSERVRIYITTNHYYSAPELKSGTVNPELLCDGTDIFSVCAVMIYLITGREFVFSSTLTNILNRHLNGNGLVQTAYLKLCEIVKYGRHPEMLFRYKSVAEFRTQLVKLLSLIDNEGVTKESLWETGKRLLPELRKSYIPNKIEYSGEFYDALQLGALGNTVLHGEGGIGKTTLYQRILSESCESYRSDSPVCIYIPLCLCDGKADFIKRYAVSRLNFGNEVSTLSDAVHRFSKLCEEENFVFLMLDGLCETGVDSTDLIRETEELGNMPGVTVSVSDRTPEALTEKLDSFKRVRLSPLSHASVKEYLLSKKAAIPEKESLTVLLTNPLMLTLYTETLSVMLEEKNLPQEENSNLEEQLKESNVLGFAPKGAAELIPKYLEALCISYRNKHPDDKIGSLRLEYILDILFPEICLACEKKTVIDRDGIIAICKRDCKKIKSRAFSKAFPRYYGRKKELLSGICDVEEWVGLAVDEILVKKTALLLREKQGDKILYRPFHMIFAETLAPKTVLDRKAYKRAAFGASLPIAAVFAALMLAGAVMWNRAYVAEPSNHPIGQEEKADNEKISDALKKVLLYITYINNEFNNIKNAATGNTSNYRDVLTQLSKAQKILELIAFDIDKEKILERAYPGIDTELLETILDMPEEILQITEAMNERVEKMYRPNSTYSDYERLNSVAGYYECIEKYIHLFLARSALLFSGVNDNADTEFKEDTLISTDYSNVYNTVITEKNPEKLAEYEYEFYASLASDAGLSQDFRSEKST